MSVGVSLVVFEAPRWVSALLHNLNAFTRTSTRVVLHLNNMSRYEDETLASWASSRVLINPERLVVGRATGSILWAHVLNVKHMALQWPDCRFVVLQASNTMWLRGGMEEVVLARSYSVPPQRWSKNGSAAWHRRYPLWRALINRSRIPHTSYHEGSFFPVSAVEAFRTFVLAWLREQRADLGSSLLRVGGYPEEWFLQAFLANSFAPYYEQVYNRTTHSAHKQLCWRAKSHPQRTAPELVEAVGCGRHRGLYATKLLRSFADNVTRVVAVLREHAFANSAACAADPSPLPGADSANALLARWDPEGAPKGRAELERIEEWCSSLSGDRTFTRFSRSYEPCS
jgi:hypothetical protein